MSKRITTESGKHIDIYDDVLTFDQMIYSYESLLKSVFRVDGIDEVSGRHSSRQVYSKFSEEDLKSFGILEHPNVKEIARKHNFSLRNIKQVRLNFNTPGEQNYLHTDRAGVTLLYYVNPEWEIAWGGHTLFLNDAAKDVEATCLYKPGRVVVFDGSIPHMIMSPTNVCPVNRLTFAIQYGVESRVVLC